MKAQKKPVQGNKAGAAKQRKAESEEEWVALEEWDKAKLKRKEAGETAGWISREVKTSTKAMVIPRLKYKDSVSNAPVRKRKGASTYTDNLRQKEGSLFSFVQPVMRGIP